jgi:hypothetical protein
MTRVCVGFKAHLGWINAVAIDMQSATPRPLDVRRVELFDDAERSVREPYHVAGGWDGLSQGPRPDDPSGIIRAGRRRQATAAKFRLRTLRSDLHGAGLRWERAVMLTGRGRIGDLEHILASHAHIHVAEGEAIRDATRKAFRSLGIDLVDQDEKVILEVAGEQLEQKDCDAWLKAQRPPGFATWRREERLIALGAWLNRS